MQLRAQNMISIIVLNSQHNCVCVCLGGGLRESLFDNEQDIRTNSENHEESGYHGLDWDLLPILY